MKNLEHDVKKEISEKREIKSEKDNSSDYQKKESENKFRNLIEFAVDGILIGSHEGYIIEANSCLCSMLGRKKETLIGKHINLSKLIFTPESIEKVPFRFDLLEKGETVISEREILRPDGSKLMVEMRTKMMPDGSYQSIFRDITERKKQESQLKKYTAELSKLNADKDLFISILAHDLSNHFNSIIGFIEILKDHFRNFTTDETAEQINIIHNSANTAFSLLQDLITWTKTQSGFIHFEPFSFNLISICDEVIKNLKYYAKGKNITLLCQIPADLMVKADIQMLKTILRNLISNAIKFTPSKGKIMVMAEKKENEILLTVSDNGIGIDPAIQNKLFKDFKTYSTNGTKGEKGTGLGLLICKMYVEKHDGKIWVESTPGKGSKFKFTLPDGSAF
ncbi:MAG: PAS domain-containing sensor histidine kinase [Mariniphaga sp.]|jgi:PAS domain S-box-containing protein|nr:PAS domain-containing sensor histidine kinase [Mariniphaga sp.]